MNELPPLEADVAPRYPDEDRAGRREVDLVSARDPRLQRPVTVKRPPASATAPDFERFLQEARLQGRLEHPALVPVLDLGIDADGRPYYVMRAVRGTSLREVLARRAAGDSTFDRRFPIRRLLAAFVDVCLAIEYAHQQGVVHRDLRPHQVLVGDFGELYVQGWGRAAPLDDAGVDVRDDVRALGGLLFEILCLRPLAPGAEVLAAARAAGRQGPPELLDACAAATEADPARRTGSARALADAVQHWLDGVRDLARRRELATRHLERARAARAEGDRPTAIREAGSAVALAPNDAAAAQLFGRLVLEPPRDSAEVAAVVAASDDLERREQAKIAAGSFLVVPLFLLILLWPGVKDPSVLIAIGAIAVAETVYALMAARGRVTTARWMWISLLGNAMMMSLFTRIYGPLLVVPAMAATLTLTSLTVPGIRPWPLVPALLGATVLGPWALEALGVIAPTTWTTGSGLVVTSSVVELPRGPTMGVLAVHTIALVAIATNYTRHLRRVNREARQRLLSQTWHLEQIAAAAEPPPRRAVASSSS